MRIRLTLACLCLGLGALAQETSPYAKFGKITVADLQRKVYSIDSNANAVVLSDIGEAAIEGNTKGWFSINFKRHKVVHILNKNGYDEADMSIYLYANGGNEEKLDNVKAVTYNLENGNIVETKLEKSSIFKEKRDEHSVVRKFTMPNVKEGSIIEIQYEVTSDYIENLDPWHFQGDCPELWSEYTLSVPEFFTYAFLSHGYLPLAINDRKDKQMNFNVSDTRSAGSTDRYSFSAGVTDYRWVMKDVPELKQESYTSALKNHRAGLEFQLSGTRYPLTPHDYRNSWPVLIRGLNESEYFGGALKKNNNWLSDDVKPVIAGAKNDREKAEKIFAYVRDNYTCEDHSALGLSQNLKNLTRTKKGNVADINILLAAMLRYADLDASPVILSTTDHGYVMDLYPMITSFNYVITQLNTNDGVIYLDASRPRLGFGHLMPECYNGHARVVDDRATALQFSADSLQERSLTSMFVNNDEKGNWIAMMNKQPGYYESMSLRDKLKAGEETYFNDVQKNFGIEMQTTGKNVDSLSRYDDPLAIRLEMILKPGSEDVLYVNPMFNEGLKKNPFKAAERYYPVEMPYTMDDTYLLTMEVPVGYVVDELPKQLVAKLDEQGSAFFEYRITQSGTTISMRTRVNIKRTLFMPEEYEALREFFNLIVNKQNEQIVFKKKK